MVDLPQAITNTGRPSTINRMDLIICAVVAPSACAAASTVGVGTPRCKISPAILCACIYSPNSCAPSRIVCILLQCLVLADIFHIVFAMISNEQFHPARGHILQQSAGFHSIWGRQFGWPLGVGLEEKAGGEC